MQNMQNIQDGAKTTLLKFLIVGACMDPFCTTPHYGRRELRDHLIVRSCTEGINARTHDQNFQKGSFFGTPRTYTKHAEKQNI